MNGVERLHSHPAGYDFGASNRLQGIAGIHGLFGKIGDCSRLVGPASEPFGGAEEMVADLKAAVFPDREIKMMVVKDGKRDVRAV